MEIKGKSAVEEVVSKGESCHGYKSNTRVSIRSSVYQSYSYDKLQKKFVMVGDHSIAEVTQSISSVNVGIEIPAANSVLQNDPEFLKTLSGAGQNFKKINLKVLLDKYCPRSKENAPVKIDSVYSFLNAILLRTDMASLLGGKSQIKHLQKTLKKFLCKSVSAKMMVGELMVGFRPDSVAWLKKYPGLVRLNVCAKILTWFVLHFLKNILYSFFHCTDSTHQKYAVFYYRKSCWQSLCDSALQSLLSAEKLRPLSSSSKQRVQSVPAAPLMARMRFIPKVVGRLTKCKLLGYFNGLKPWKPLDSYRDFWPLI